MERPYSSLTERLRPRGFSSTHVGFSGNPAISRSRPRCDGEARIRGRVVIMAGEGEESTRLQNFLADIGQWRSPSAGNTRPRWNGYQDGSPEPVFGQHYE